MHGKRVVRSQIDGDTDWRGAVIDKDLIIHSAARARAIKDEVVGSLKEYRQDNVNVTINLAREAAEVSLKDIFAQYS